MAALVFAVNAISFVLSAVLMPLQKDLGINDGQAGRLAWIEETPTSSRASW